MPTISGIESKVTGFLKTDLSIEATTTAIDVEFVDEDDNNTSVTLQSDTLDFTIDPLNETGNGAERICCASTTADTPTTGITRLNTVQRGLLRYGTGQTGSATYAKSYAQGTRVAVSTDALMRGVNILKSYLTTDPSTTTRTGAQTFTGAVTMTKSLLHPVYADATARDAAITVPANGMIIYNTALGVHQEYITGAWANMTSGSVTPNSADHTGGKVDIASATEIGAGTATDATSSAVNVIPVSQTAKTSSGAGDENKLPVLNSSGQLATGFVNLSALDGNNAFGNGSTGAYTASSGTLTADIFATDATIPAGVTLNTGGYRIYATGTFTVEATGVLQNNGSAGGNGGAGAVAVTTTGGAAGSAGAAGATIAPGVTVPPGLIGKIGGAGGAGANTNASGASGANGTAGDNITNGIGVIGLIGKIGGHGGDCPGVPTTGGIGGTAGAAGTFAASSLKVKTLSIAELLFDVVVGTRFYTSSGSGRSCGGGGGAGFSSGNGGGGGGGGGGNGCTGGTVWVAAKTIVNGGTIKANGGNGGDGGAGGSSSGANGGVGAGGSGGSGGSGGVIILIYKDKSGAGTLQVAGGTGGSLGAIGAVGNTTNATAATAGNNGGTGTTYKIELT